MNESYFIFVLGYDLLHDMLDGIYCDIAYEICTLVYRNFLLSEYNNIMLSEYECLLRYVRAHKYEIKRMIEEEE